MFQSDSERERERLSRRMKSLRLAFQPFKQMYTFLKKVRNRRGNYYNADSGFWSREKEDLREEGGKMTSESRREDLTRFILEKSN